MQEAEFNYRDIAPSRSNVYELLAAYIWGLMEGKSADALKMQRVHDALQLMVDLLIVPRMGRCAFTKLLEYCSWCGHN